MTVESFQRALSEKHSISEFTSIFHPRYFLCPPWSQISHNPLVNMDHSPPLQYQTPLPSNPCRPVGRILMERQMRPLHMEKKFTKMKVNWCEWASWNNNKKNKKRNKTIIGYTFLTNTFPLKSFVFAGLVFLMNHSHKFVNNILENSGPTKEKRPF